MSNPTRPLDLDQRLPQLIRADFDRAFRGLFRHHGAVETTRRLQVRTELGHPFGNLAFSNRSPTPEEVREDVEVLLDDGFPSAYMCTESIDEASDAVLAECGFQLAEDMPLMALDLARLDVPAAPDGYRIARADAGLDEDWVEAMSIGYELPRPLVAPMGPGTIGDRLDGTPVEFHVVHHGREPVGTSMFTSHDGVVGVYCIATAPAHRGRGIGAWATAAPLAALRDAGHHTAVLQSSLMGAPVYRRLGFTDHGTMPLYVRMPGNPD